MDGPMDTAVEGRPKGNITKGPLQYIMLRSLQFQLVERRKLLKNFVQGGNCKRFLSHPEMSGCWWKDGVVRRIWKQQETDSERWWCWFFQREKCGSELR